MMLSKKAIIYYLDAAKYCKHLNLYYNLFPTDNIKVLILDEMVANPRESIRYIYKFLGVNESFVPASLNEKN